MNPRLSQVLDKDLKPVFEGRTKSIDSFLATTRPNPGRWVRLARSGRIITVEDYLKEG